MLSTPKILFLKQEEVIEAGILDMEACLNDVEHALGLLGRGEINNPSKTSIKLFNNDGSWRSTNNSMPVYIGGSVDRSGIKWASESSLNSETKDLPMGIDILTLSDPNTVLPVAIMDATLITAMRTAANAIMAVKYLASKSTTKVTVIGAGVIGRTMLMALSHLDWEFNDVRICDLQLEKAQGLVNEFKEQLPVRAVTNIEEAVRGAEVVLTATTAKKAIIDVDWLGDCTLRVQSAQNEFPPEALLNADLITLDDWEQMTSLNELTFKKLVDQGDIKRSDVIMLSDIIANKSKGRTDEDQVIQHLSRGLACLDVMVGERIYQQACKLGIGQEVKLWDCPRWL